MNMEFCTLFDSNYIDKGIVCYNSLLNVCMDFNLYILAMDKKCSEVLNKLNLKNIIVIDYEEFEDEDLREIKKHRKRAEFCWTCTPKLVKYVLSHYSVDFCTYIDADMYFYSDPSVLIREMLERDSSVQIVKHNFPYKNREKNEKKAGIYCVEFNTFLNNQSALEVLNSWEQNCIKDCSYLENENVLGDQKYLNDWPKTYDCINISKNQGAGIAPWNINKFNFSTLSDGYIIDSETGEKITIIFFHFQNLKYIDENRIACCSVKKNNYLEIKELYTSYLKEIQKEKILLKNEFNIDNFIMIHPAEEGMVLNHKMTIRKRLFFLVESLKRKLGLICDVVIQL